MDSQRSLGGIHGSLGGTDGTLGPMGPWDRWDLGLKDPRYFLRGYLCSLHRNVGYEHLRLTTPMRVNISILTILSYAGQAFVLVIYQ